MKRRLIVIDTSYTLDAIRSRSLVSWIQSRSLDGYFEKVWTLHPFSDIIDVSHTHARPYLKLEELDSRSVFASFYTSANGERDQLRLLRFLRSQVMLLWLVVQLIKKERISLIHALDPGYSGLLAVAASRITRRPLVIWARSHNADLRASLDSPIHPRLFRWKWLEVIIERFTYRRADVVFAYAHYVARYAEDCGVDKAKIVILGQERDMELSFMTGTRGGKRSDSTLRAYGANWTYPIVLVSRCEVVKRPLDAIKSVLLLVEDGIDAGLVVVGGGSQLEELTRFVEISGHSDRVIFLGFQSSDVIHNLLEEVELVVSPLTGTALLEAGYSKCAVVAYDTDWHGELIQHELSGLLVPNGDVRGLADGLLTLIRDPLMRDMLARNLLEKCLRRPSARQLHEIERAKQDELLRNYLKT